LKAYNITDKAQQRSLFLDSIGEVTLDIFEQLSHTGTDLDGAVNALRDKFKESQNRLYNIHKFRCIKQGKDETWDSFISKLRAEGEHCDFPTGWLVTEILMAMIESGQPKHPDDNTVRKRDREQKEKMKKYADKRRHTAVMRIKVGDTVLCKQEKKNSLTSLFDPVPMVVIGIKGDITARNNQKIRTRNYAD